MNLTEGIIETNSNSTSTVESTVGKAEVNTKVILSLWKAGESEEVKIGFTRVRSSEARGMAAFVREVVLVAFADSIAKVFKDDDYFADLRDAALSELEFTALFEGAPYTPAQLESETMSDFVRDAAAQPTGVPRLVLHFTRPKTDEADEADEDAGNKTDAKGADKDKAKEAEPPKEAKVRVHEVVWKDVKDCRGNVARVKLISFPDKKKTTAKLKSTLRRVTGLNMFQRENLEFRPAALLKHINALKDAVFGPEPEKPEADAEPEAEPEAEAHTGAERDPADPDRNKAEVGVKVAEPAQAETKTHDPADSKGEAEKEKEKAKKKIPALAGPSANVEGMQQLVAQLLEEFSAYFKHQEELVKEGKVAFDQLHMHFGLNQKVCFRNSDGTGLIGGKVTRAEYQRGWASSYFELEVQVIKSTGKAFFYSSARTRLSEFDDTKRIDELPVKLLAEGSAAMAELEARGAKFEKQGLGSHQLAQTDNVQQKTWCSVIQQKAFGRCMVDTATFGKMNPNQDNDYDEEEDEQTLAEVPPHLRFLCWTAIKGFSFACKKWGELAVDHLAEIQFDEQAQEQLVLSADRKTLIKSLVQNYQGSFKDIIGGKGGGCIFLLHGPPGTGKTLTAEAISELLRKPLYSVTVGELGTTISELEDKLRNILEVACQWDAVILLDEADIFLEQRSDNDIHRNAMVGIFLRLLEQHNGVLFLTTNRVRRFDGAFHSRISIALHYAALAEADRAQVWRNLLAHAQLDTAQLDVARLATHDINGRQIKNVIRLSQTVAKDKLLPFDTALFEANIRLTSAFLNDNSIDTLQSPNTDTTTNTNQDPADFKSKDSNKHTITN